MAISQKQIRDSYTATVIAAALVGRDTEVIYIEELNNYFHYIVDALLVDDGATILPALGTNAHWVVVGATALKDNLAGVVGPTTTDDSASGYAVGSVWIDVLADNSYICADATPTAAVWRQTNTAVSPTVNLLHYKIRGVAIDLTTTTGSQIVPISLLANGNVSNGSPIFALSEVDPQTIRAIDTLTIPAANAGTYIISGSIVHPRLSIGGVGGQNSNSMIVAGVKINGVDNWIALDRTTGLDDRFVWSEVFDLAAGDTISMIMGGNNAANEDFAVSFSLAQLPTQSVTNASLINNLAATAAPGLTDDSASGYAVGSTWIDTTADNAYVCLDSTATAAVWNQINSAGVKNNFIAIVAPATTDDSAAGYVVGSTWIDVTADKSYTCVDNTIAAAIWDQTGGVSIFTSNIANAVAAWGAAAGGLYTITVTTATHGITTPKIVQVYETVAGVNQIVIPAVVGINNTSGDVTVSVSDIPDSRFVGDIQIQ